MTITGNLRVKQPFVGIEVAPNNDSPFWGEKKIYREILLQKSDKNTSKISLKQKKRCLSFFRIDTLISRHKQGGVMPVGVERTVLS